MPTSAPDPVRVIEQAYRLELDEKRWIEGLLESASPLLRFPGSIGSMAFIFDARSGKMKIRLSGSRDLDERIVANASKMLDFGPRAMEQPRYQRLLGSSTAMASLSGTMPELAAEYARKWREQLDAEVVAPRDRLSTLILVEPGLGLLMGTFLSQRAARPAPGILALWERLGAHIASAFRLRRILSSAAPTAVVSTSGRIEQADGALGERRALREIGRAARAIGEARGALRRTDPARAVEIWRSLVDGRWSLVDAFVQNGQQYLVARENCPPLLEPGAQPLSQRQQQMLFFVAQGHSNKVIAYELGISESTVATHLRRAMVAMKCHSRLELVQRARVMLSATA